MAHDHRPLYDSKPGARKITHKATGAVVYVFETRPGRYSAALFRSPRQMKPLAYWFGTGAHREQWIRESFDALQKRAAATAARRATDTTADRVEPGVILVASWGYDRTNIDWYEVVERIGKCTVVLQQIGAATATDDRSVGNMTADVVPNPQHKIGKPFRKRVHDGAVKLSGYAHARVWDGKPRYSSWYA